MNKHQLRRFLVPTLATIAGGLSWILLLALIGIATPPDATAASSNGFDLDGALVPADQIHAGGPARDGIPAIDHPRFVRAGSVDYLAADDRVLGVIRNGVKKAYPIAIMNWHEIVNDRFDGDAVVVTYCPLCGTGIAFESSVSGDPLSFGVSGLLYNSDMLLYDRQSESLWSQIAARAISGKHRGQRLTMVPSSHTSWSDWRRRHPDTLVLSRDTGYRRDYDRAPYAGYESSSRLYFPVAFRARGYHPKERVLGIEVAGRYKAYPFAELARAAGAVEDRVAGQRIVVHFDKTHRAATASTDTGNANGRELTAVTAFWFAWYAFHPDTDVYRAEP